MALEGLRPGKPRRRRVWRRVRAQSRVGFKHADRLTQALAVLTATTMVAVIAGEFARRFRRRAATEDVAVAETPGETLHLAGMATQDTLRVARAGYSSTPASEVVLFNLLTGFAGAFAVARLSTSGIRRGWWPFTNVEIGGRHIHHFVPGILLAFGAATAALISDDHGNDAALAVPFGAGVGLTFDEAALLLDFRDVYWTREGLLSIQLSLGGLVLLGGTILALRMIRRGEVEVADRGLIPDAYGGMLAPSPVAAPQPETA